MHQQVQKQLLSELCGLSETLRESITTPLAGAHSVGKPAQPVLGNAPANTPAPAKLTPRRDASSKTKPGDNTKPSDSSAAPGMQCSLPLNEI